jgi:hypothetical protein
VNQCPPFPVDRVKRFVAESLPVAALAQSYLVDSRWDPALRDQEPLGRFTENALHELHHLMALWGALLRGEAGDPTAWSRAGLNLARFLERRRMTLTLAQQLPVSLRQHPSVQLMMTHLEESNRQVQRAWPILVQTVVATGWQGAAPTVFGQ